MLRAYDVVLYLDGEITAEVRRFELLTKQAAESEERVLFLRLELRDTKVGTAHKKV